MRTNRVSTNGRARLSTVPEGYVYGYQVEIDTDLKGKTFTGGIYDEHRRGGYIDPDDGANGPHGKAFTELNRKITKPDDWNHLRVVAIGDHIKTYLNGVLRADMHDADDRERILRSAGAQQQGSRLPTARRCVSKISA